MEGLGGLVDTRVRPRIPTRSVVLSLFVMLLSRLGSLNALEQMRCHQGIWRRLLGRGRRLPSADTLSRVQALLDPEAIRDLLHAQYARLKRGKALPAPLHGLVALVIDGHESTASYRRRCQGCLRRNIRARSGMRTQHHHNYVVAMLAGEGFELLIDEEPQRSGENEVGAALRLLRRVHERYPRAFDVVVADALYANTTFFREVLERGKDVLAVLKHRDWALWREARALCDVVEAKEEKRGTTERRTWDIDSLPWAEFPHLVRVVRSEETTRVRRQASKTVEEVRASWWWLTTLPSTRASTRTVIDLGHRRWAIENEGFNEGVRAWHMDHVYRHEPRAMEVMLLLLMLAYNLLHTFYARNLKPALRHRYSLQHVAREITASLYVPATWSRAPP